MANANIIKPILAIILSGLATIMVYRDVYALRDKSIYKEHAQRPWQFVRTAYVKMGKHADLAQKIAASAHHLIPRAGTDNVITVNRVYHVHKIVVAVLRPTPYAEMVSVPMANRVYHVRKIVAAAQ